MIRTLLVDDFEDLLFIACKFLEKQAPDIEVVTCESAKNALKKLNEEHFDIIVSDYQMPEMDGLEFLKVVRKSGNEIPFIIFTGRGREEVAIQALNFGATHYLKKGGEQKSQFAELAHHIRTAVSHRRSEIALHESEGRYRSLFEDAAVSLWEEDFSAVKIFFDERRAEGITDFREYFENNPEKVEKCVNLVIVTDVNKASLVAQGVRKKEELIGPLERVFVRDALEVYKEELISLAEGNTLFKSEIHLLNDVAGRKHAFIFQLNVPPGYEETLAKVYLSIIDVTKQYQSEILAEQESQKAQTYLELSSVMFVALDRKGKISFVNSHTCSILGYEENELIGKDWFDLAIPKIVKEEVKDAFKAIMDGSLERVAKFENPVLTKGGDERIIAWHNTYLTDESGKINGVLSSGDDITDKKMMDEALKESEEQSRLVLSSLMDRIFVFDKDNFYSQVYTPDGSDSTYSKEYLLGKHASEVVPPHLLDSYLDLLTKIRETGIPQTFEYSVERQGMEKSFISTLTLHEDGESIVSVAREITDTKKAEQSMRESEERYRLVLGSMKNPIFVIDKDNCYSQIYSYDEGRLIESVEKMLGKHLSETTPPHLLEAYVEKLTKARETGISQTFEYSYEQDRKDRWFVSTITLHEDGESVVSISNEITDMKLAEQSLKESEERYRLVLDSMNDLIFVFDKDDCYRQVYASDESLLIAPLDDIIGKHARERMLPHLLTLHLEISNKVRETGESLAYDYQLELGGKEKWFTATLSLHKDNESIVSTIRDVTDTAKAPLALTEKEEKWRSLTENSPDRILTLDRDLKILFANRASEGLNVDDMIGISILGYLDSENRPRIKEILERVIETGETAKYETEYQLPDGNIIYYETRVNPLNEDDQIIGLTLIARDTTERWM
ncbi:MAG: PAS domain S-box protein [Candidatus Thorarchaeota archaeon]